MVTVTLANRLKERRWTQADLARKTGIRPSTIGDMYNGYTERITLKHLGLICKALECDISDILTLDVAGQSESETPAEDEEPATGKHDTTARDAAFAEHQNILNGCIRRNLPLILALQLEVEDVVQDLSFRLIKSIERYDSERACPLPAFLYHELQHEILDIRRRHKPHGIIGVPDDMRLDIVSLDQPREDGTFFELPAEAEYDSSYAEAMEALPADERAVVARKMSGYPIRKKAEREYLEKARETLSVYFQTTANVA